MTLHRLYFNRHRALGGLFAFALLLVLLLHGCAASNNSKLKPLRIGLNSWPGFDIALYAKDAGLFERRGLDVEFVRFDVSQDTGRALMRGSLDAAFVSLWDLMQVDSGSDTPVYIMVTNISHGSDGIVTQPTIQAVEDLRGKTVGAKLGTVSHLILLEALQAHQIEPEEVRIEDISNAIAEQRIQQGKLDAAVLWEPSLSTVATAIDGNIIFTTQDVDSLVIDGLASRSSFIKANSKDLQQFILAWFDLMQAVEDQPDAVFAAVSQQLGQTQESFAKDYAGLLKGDVALNQRMFEPQGRLMEVQSQIIQLLQKDPRHGRMIREDIEINAEPVTAAIQAWKP
jgi:NitT/TauT family transport system substrate-binding protein